MHGGMMWRVYLSVITAITILAAGSALYAYNKGRQSGMQQVQTSWDSEKLAMKKANTEELMKARQREQALQALNQRLRQERANEVRRLAAEYAADLERLRDRPETRAGAGGVPEGAAAGVGCTGAGLARGDAGFLAGYAHDAARLQLALDSCQAAYEAVRQSTP